MRLWSIHPCYLDQKGLVALWREALLAQKVLQGQTKGYRFHPQLQRFRDSRSPVVTISSYLWVVHDEATRRGYSFDCSKIAKKRRHVAISVADGQLKFELRHLRAKLKNRDVEQYRKLRRFREATAHPIFNVVKGLIEVWERP
jgi:hypothetical protein